MTNASHVPLVCLLLLRVLVIAVPSSAQERPPIAQQIAKAYGLDSFGQIEAIRYTFNAKGVLNLARTWIWEPKTNQVSYEGRDKAGKPQRIFFSNVSVKLAGSDTWLNTQ